MFVQGNAHEAQVSMRPHGISTHISGAIRGHSRISGPTRAAAATEDVLDVRVD